MPLGRPWVDRRQVVHDQRDRAARWTFRNFFDLPSAPADDDRAGVGVDDEVGRVVLYLPVGRDGGQPPDVLRGQVVELCSGEDQE